MRTRKIWWRLLSGGMAALFCPALLAGAGGLSAPASAAALTPKAAARVTLGGTWGTAIEVPGLAALDKGGDGDVESVSCASPGNCGAAGTYADRAGIQAFVANQTNGTWGKAIPIPGLAALNVGGAAEFTVLSCASPGNCSAGGEYSPRAQEGFQAFVVTETNGTWGKAIQVPGIVPLNTDGEAHVSSTSCGAAGNCSAGGSTSLRGHVQAWVVNQAHSTWGKAIEVPGTAALNKGGEAGINSLSCTAPGRCSAGGFYLDSHDNLRGFVVSET